MSRALGGAKAIGTDIEFLLSRQEDYTVAQFGHRYWRKEVEFMAHCSTKWATFPLSLRNWSRPARESRHLTTADRQLALGRCFREPVCLGDTLPSITAVCPRPDRNVHTLRVSATITSGLQADVSVALQRCLGGKGIPRRERVSIAPFDWS
jgi:hypothetical protein